MGVILIVLLAALTVLICMVVVGTIKEWRIDIIASSISILTVIIFAYTFFSNNQCRILKRHGFDYEIADAVSPTWDSITFFFEASNDERMEGPLVAGTSLKVKCRDIDKDDVPEFVIQSKITEEYQTILKVDFESGEYHVHFTEGLKVDHPPDGYYYH